MNESLFLNYQKLINSIATSSNLSEETLYNISKINVFEGYNDAVASQLCQNNYTYEFIQISIFNETEISYDQESILQTIKNNKSKFLSNKELFLKMRENICKRDYSTLKNYSFLFDEDCPAFTENELYLLDEMVKNDSDIFPFIQPDLVDDDFTEIFIAFLNRKYHNNNEAFEILKFIALFNKDLANLAFYSLNFEYVKYRSFSKGKKDIIKLLFEKILNLHTNENRIKFMKTTGFLENEWEIEMLDDLKDDEDLRKEYIDAVNSCQKISKNTINILVRFSTISPMSNIVNDMFFETQNYTHYVVSKTISNNYFFIETGTKEKVLWPVYLQIFNKQIYPKTCKYMQQNKEFLRRIQERKDYRGFSEKARMQLVGIEQDEASLKNVFEEYGENFALEYYCNIQGFKDWEAASTFVDIVIQNPLLKSSQKLYNHTHEKLVDGKLKFRYTMRRKR